MVNSQIKGIQLWYGSPNSSTQCYPLNQKGKLFIIQYGLIALDQLQYKDQSPAQNS